MQQSEKPAFPDIGDSLARATGCPDNTLSCFSAFLLD